MNASSSPFGVKLGLTCLEDRLTPTASLLSQAGLNSIVPPPPPPPTGPIVVILPPGSGGQSGGPVYA